MIRTLAAIAALRMTVMKMNHVLQLALIATLPSMLVAQENAATSTRFQALKCPTPSLGQAWGVLDHDGANRKVTPYLSSLANGETGTGMITSPPFFIEVDTIKFTICGHDGPQGGRNENYIALVDARKGQVLLKTAPPQNDGMQEQSWDVKNLRNTQVRIELRDGCGGSGFAWFGVGKIDAGPSFQVDFSKGMPKNWAEPQKDIEIRYETLAGGVPFKRVANVYSVLPRKGDVEIPCGFTATRLYFLGGTVNGGKPLETYGGIEVHYKTGSPEVFPLMCGFTLDDAGKLLGKSEALHLHASADPYQHYLVIAPRSDAIEKIRLVAAPDGLIPRITAITIETDAKTDSLMPLPATEIDTQESAWIESHGIAHGKFDLLAIMKAIRAANQLPETKSPVGFKKHRLDDQFRSEGVTIADMNGDGKADIACGNVYYAGPDWKMVSMLSEPKAFNRNGYSDAFLCYADDINKDKHMDLVVVGFPGQESRWMENPGPNGGVWKAHPAVAKTGNENPAYLDVDGDGRPELVFMSEAGCAFAQPAEDVTKPWNVRPIANKTDPSAPHGLGVGDINRDNHFDVLIPDGWWDGAAAGSKAAWSFHPAKFFGGAQLCVADLDGDGDNDVLGSSPHAYGIAWCEQTADGWVTHEIDSSISQTHAIKIADMNGDGLLDFVTGKRFWAHNGHDAGSFQPSFLCWYEQKRVNGKPEFTQHLIDAHSGVGLQFEIADLNNDKKPDIITSNKNGVFVFEQE